MTSAGPYIDKLSLDLTDEAPEKRADLWSDYVRPAFDVSALGHPAPSFAPRSNVWLLDKLLMAEATFGGMLWHRHKRHLRADVDQLLSVQIRSEGGLVGDLAGEPARAGPGDINVLDYSREYRSRSTPTRMRALLFSHSVIGYDPGRHPAVIRIPGDSVLGQVLRNSILSVYSQLDRTTKAEAAEIAGSLIALLRGVLFATAGANSPSFVAARNRAIRDHIEQNLGDERLGAETLCARFNVSRATLYRDFKAEGGLQRYILGRKLDAAVKGLAFGSNERGAVTRVSERWGFSSTSHFCREFKRRFGVRPSEVVAEHPREATNGAGDAAWIGGREPAGLSSFLKQL